MISKVRGALVYPVIVLFVIGGVVIFLLTTVVPQIELIYKDFNKELPFFTNILIKTANFIINYWVYHSSRYWRNLLLALNGSKRKKAEQSPIRLS
jgi:type II secretory pathway component PulF